MKGGSVIPKQLSEEEKEEAEAAVKAKGKAPPKPKKGQEEEDPTPEELEQLEKQKAEKQELERKKQEEWEALDEDTKFYRTNEDSFKEPSIKFHIEVESRPETALEGEKDDQAKDQDQPNEPQNEGEEQQPKTHLEDASVSETKMAEELIELEEYITDEKGCWIFFNKVLPKEDEEVPDPKKKGKPAKGASAEDDKPIYGRAWLDLSTLKEPGETKISARIYLKTTQLAQPKIENEEGAEAQLEPNENEEVKEEPKIFEDAQTYIKLDFETSEPIVPTEDKFVHQALPHDLILPKAVTLAKIKPVKDPEGDFRKQLTLAIECVNQEYLNMFEEDLKREGIGACSDETFEARKEQFLYDFNTQGKYHIMKEKLKKVIVKIVRDTFNKRKGFKGLHMDDQDHFYSILYAHLVNQIQFCIKEMTNQRKDVLHENVLIADKKAALKEVEVLLDTHTKETEDERLTRLSEEYEELGELDKAHSYIEARIKANADSIDLWRFYALFMLRNYGHFEKAEECLREAITL